MAKVLIVDDSALARNILKKAIIKLGHTVVGEADSGEKALLDFRKHVPDIVTMDVIMKGITGIDCSKKILSFYPNTKIIIVTSHFENDIKEELIQNKLPYLVEKPIDEGKLAAAIDNALSGAASNISTDDEKSKKMKADMQKFLKDVARKINQQNNPTVEEEIKVQYRAALYYYTFSNPVLGMMTLQQDNMIDFCFTESITKFKMIAGEPVILSYVEKDSFKFAQAGIVDINPKEKTVRLRIEKSYIITDPEMEEKFPVSLSVDFKAEFQNKKRFGVIKSLGSYSMSLISQADMNTGESINFNIYLEEKVLNLNAEIVTRVEANACYEYDIKITFIDLGSKKLLNQYVNDVKNQMLLAIQAE